MDPQSLIRAYPWLDHLMAETILKIHEQGKLHDYLQDWPAPAPASHVIKGAVKVETPPEKSAPTE